LPDIHTSRAEGEDALDIRLLILRAEVEVESILDDLAIRNPYEKDVRRNVDLAAPLGWLDGVLVVALEGDTPSESLRPEASEALTIGGVDDNALDPDVHEPTISSLGICKLYGWPQTFVAVLWQPLLRGACSCFHPADGLPLLSSATPDSVGVRLPVRGAVLFVGGARAAGAALVGSSVCAVVAALLSGVYGGDHLETLVHGAVILASVGLVGFGLAGLSLEAYAPLGRYPMALALAFGTVVVGTLLILRIHAEAAPSCSLQTGLRVSNASSPFAASCFRGFEDPWVQALLAFNVAFLALLFLVQAWQASRSSGKQEEEDGPAWWLIGPYRDRRA
jgi:hypothetical protein